MHKGMVSASNSNNNNDDGDAASCDYSTGMNALWVQYMENTAGSCLLDCTTA